MSNYNSNHLDGSYGNPGFFVARTTGTVRDSSGRTTDLTPDLTQRSARRLLIRTADLPPPVDGVYTAEIRPAKGTTGVKLAHVAIPRSTARVRAQLTLYSIPIIDRSDDEAHSTSQRYCRNQLMSKDTSDFPFFDVAVSDTDTENLTSFAYFDWRARESASNTRRFTWLSTSDRSSSIAPGMRSKFTNQYIDLDSLTVAVPSDCTVHELGNAFAHALKTHAGARHEKNSSIWNRYEIAVTESGFSVYEHMDVSDPFNTFAVHRRPDQFDDDFEIKNETLQVGSSAYEVTLETPLTIRLNKARSVFIATDRPNDESPIAHITGTHHKYAEFAAEETDTPDVFQIDIPQIFDTFKIHSLSFPNDVTSENILGVYTKFGTDNQKTYNIAPVTRTYQKQRDVRLGLRWGDKREGTDFLIDNNEQYESELTAGGVRQDVATLTTLTGTTSALTRDIFNDLCTTSELQDTFRSSETTMHQLFSVRKQNDAHQMQDMLFAGHMMNVAEPTPMPVSDAIAPENLERPEPTIENPSTKAFYADNLGWETSVISGPSNYVMAAFPVRNTHEEYSSNIDSFFGTIRTSVSPLVAKILSEHGGETNDKGFYAEMSQSTGQEHNRYDQVDLTHFEPRTEGLHSNAIVVLIGDQNYIIKSARPVSLLRNDTQHHLNLKCDGPSEVVLKSSKIRQRLEHQLRTLKPIPGQSQAQYAETVAELTRQINDNQANETHSFYSLAPSDQDSGVNSYRAHQDAKYFAWVFELDRPIQLSNEPDEPPTTNTFLQRSFTGLTDRASMFVPGVYHEDAGRAAPSTVQQAAHSFFVRNGAAAEDQTLLLLHGIGNIERPLNSTANTSTEGLFTVLSAETDHKKPLQSACESSAWMRPQNIHNLKFSFVSSRTGEKLPIKDNATLLFDIYCENE